MAKLNPLVAGDGFRILDTPKNMAFLTESGLNKAAIKEELLELKVRDYSRGPLPDDKPDRNPPLTGAFWIFKREFMGWDMYIKIYMEDAKAPIIAQCWSFHP